MRQKKYYINLKILIPLIFTGISLMGLILACQIAGHFKNGHAIDTMSFFELMVFIGGLTYLASFFVMKLFLKPIEKFVQRAQQVPALQDILPPSPVTVTDDVQKIEKVFDNVANVLSLVESRELFPNIIGASPVMRNVFKQITKVAPTDSTVLISGESGTGKELIAQSIYEHSARKGKPFVKINCVAIPEGLLESELFGHEKGAFTGAVAQKKGKFELADGGTIFLDEIGDMPLATQAKLLRVLQEKEFERVGGSRVIRVDVRFIAATNQDLSKLIKKGAFREDLYFRLNVFSIVLPPLRERVEDIPLLANYFLSQQSPKRVLSPGVLQLLIGYAWPGNIRELKNVLEQAAVLAEKETIEKHHLPEAIKGKFLSIEIPEKNLGLNEKLQLVEKDMILNALRASGGVQVKAAAMLGINQRSLWHRIKKLNIDVDAVKHLQ